MRVPPPPTLRIDRADLLRDLVERLEDKAPDAIRRDPTDPAWLVLEESAWMVEVLSEQLDEYPWAVVQQLAHLLGVSLRPARPSVGVVALEALSDGRVVAPASAVPWRFVTLQTETAGLIEFELAEPEVPVMPATIAGLARLRDGELWRVTPGPSPELPGQVAWGAEEVRSGVFSKEVFQYRFVSTDPEALVKQIEAAHARWFEERPPGWLSIEVGTTDDGVLVQAVLDPNLTFVGAPEEGGDLSGPWRPLDESTWTPPVRVHDHPVLPVSLRNTRPMRLEEDRIFVPGVPSNMLVDELLVRDARPAPDDVPKGIWRTLVHFERKLASLRPEIRRGVVVPGGGTEPSWVDDALRGGGWFRVAERADQSFAHLAFDAGRSARTLRVAWMHAGEADREIQAFALLDGTGMLPDPIPATPAWSMVLPDPSRGRMMRVQAVTLTVPPNAVGVLTSIPGAAAGALVNAAMVLNAPRIEDDREVVVDRAVPDAVSLLSEDVVGPEALGSLADGGLPASATGLLGRLPLSRIEVDGKEPIVDFEGVGLDAAEGTVTLLSPDRTGALRRLKRGDALTLRWYRRTEGAHGNVPAGSITFVEQSPSARPRLTGVTNPLPTAWGLDREDPKEAMRRVFGPSAGVPITPTDWERELRVALGSRARGWHVRVWGHAERAFLSTALWPPRTTPQPDADRDALAAALAGAGPDALLFVLGAPDGPPDAVELAWAREVAEALVAQWSGRLPAIRRAIVAPMHVLRLQGTSDGPLPTHTLDGLVGTLSDAAGRSGDVPDAALMLNALIADAVRA